MCHGFPGRSPLRSPAAPPLPRPPLFLIFLLLGPVEPLVLPLLWSRGLTSCQAATGFRCMNGEGSAGEAVSRLGATHAAAWHGRWQQRFSFSSSSPGCSSSHSPPPSPPLHPSTSTLTPRGSSSPYPASSRRRRRRTVPGSRLRWAARRPPQRGSRCLRAAGRLRDRAGRWWAEPEESGGVGGGPQRPPPRPRAPLGTTSSYASGCSFYSNHCKK